MRWLLTVLLIGGGLVAGNVQARNWQTDPEFRERLLSDPRRCARAVRNQQNYLQYWPENYQIVPVAYAPKVHAFQTYEAFGDLAYRGCEAANHPIDKFQAAIWYEKSAIGHWPPAQFKLGRMLYEGDGIQRDPEYGIAWLTSAALEKNEDARQYLTRIGINVSPTMGPSTYEHMERLHRLEVSAQRRELLSGTAHFIATVATAYFSAQGATDNRSRSGQAPVQYTRPRPTYCATNVRALITGTDAMTFVNATRTSFCN